MTSARRLSPPEPEPCTRLGALDAGWRYAIAHPSDVLVLQHTGADVGRWQLKAAHLGHGVAVGGFKALRHTLVRGALALWHDGRVTRYETGPLAPAVSRKGAA